MEAALADDPTEALKGESRTLPLRTIANRTKPPVSHATVKRVVERLVALDVLDVSSSEGRGRPLTYRVKVPGWTLADWLTVYKSAHRQDRASIKVVRILFDALKDRMIEP